MKRSASQIPASNEALFLDYGHIFTMSSMLFDTEHGKRMSTFDVTIRDMPGNRNFLLLGGIEDMINTITNWTYDAEFVAYLLKEGYISNEFANFLKSFRFKDDLWAIPEGTIIFPNEPIIRISAPLAVANLLTGFLVNAISYPTLFLSKAIRIRLASNDKPFNVAGSMRAPGFENILKIQRLSYICGSIAIIPFAKFHYAITQGKPAANLYHAAIKAFGDEKTAYRHFLRYTKNFGLSASMVDTYNIISGIENWIAIEKEARAQNKTLGWVNIDSGDLYKNSLLLRKKLDQAGLNDVKIIAHSNLNEYKITELERKGAKIDLYIAITEVLNIADCPTLEAVYKLAEIANMDGVSVPVAKLTPGKSSLPGKKQVFRTYTKKGYINRDIIGLEDEALGAPILIQYIKNGKQIQKLPDLEELKKHINKQLDILPKQLKNIEKKFIYDVSISKKLQSIVKNLNNNHNH